MSRGKMRARCIFAVKEFIQKKFNFRLDKKTGME
jgi:hypothetical protein